jgi:hypothetical protein
MTRPVRELGALFEVGTLGGLSDEPLLGRFVERREEAVFEAIVRHHGPMVWGVCRRAAEPATTPRRRRSWSKIHWTC